MEADFRFGREWVVSYSLFLPKPLVARFKGRELKGALSDVPLATSMGGQFREDLEAAASKARWKLQIELGCASFTQAARAVETGAFGAVLPSLAASQFDHNVVEFELPFLKPHARPICVVWNPRLAEVRPLVGRAISALRGVFEEGVGVVPGRAALSAGVVVVR